MQGTQNAKPEGFREPLFNQYIQLVDAVSHKYSFVWLYASLKRNLLLKKRNLLEIYFYRRNVSVIETTRYVGGGGNPN